MEEYVSPACTVEAVADDAGMASMAFNWTTLIATILITAGMTIASRVIA